MIALLLLEFIAPAFQGAPVLVLSLRLAIHDADVEKVVAFLEKVISDSSNLGVGELFLLGRQRIGRIIAQAVEVGHFRARPKVTRRLNPFSGPGLVRLLANA